MKALILAVLLFSNSAFATTQIVCADANHSVTINVDDLKSEPPQSSYSLIKDGGATDAGSTVKIFEGADGFLKLWIWAFRSENFIGGVALTSAKHPSPGKHAGKADLFVKYQGGYWDATSVDCQIEIK